MPELMEDQAASLRRLLGGATLRSALFIGGDAGIGQTALVANVAHALARRGHAVLVIDAQPQLRSGARWFSLSPRGDLADVLAGERYLDEVLLHAPAGVTWVPAARLRHGGGPSGSTPAARHAAERVLLELAAAFDTVLLDVPADRVEHWWPAAAHAQAVLLGAGEQTRSITAAYAVLKSLVARVGQQRYLWWMARSAVPETAEASFRKVAQTARHFLHVTLELAAAIPADPVVARAERLRRPLADAFPGSRAGAACAVLATRLESLPRPEQPAGAAWRGLLGAESPMEPTAADPVPGAAVARAPYPQNRPGQAVPAAAPTVTAPIAVAARSAPAVP